MSTKTISVRKFTDEQLNTNQSPFDVNAYSKMKHGSHMSARLIAKDMAKHISQNLGPFLSNKQVVIIPAPMSFSPIASSILARYVFLLLADNNFGAKFGWDTVKRTQAYVSDYQFMSAEERIAALADDPFLPHVEFLGNKTLLFIDDVHITGAHTVRLEQMIQKYNMTNETIICTYGEYLGQDPTTEARINHWFIKTQMDLVKNSYEPDFEMTLRGAKFMLKLEGDNFREHFSKLSTQGKHTMWHAMLGKGYHQMDLFKGQTKIIKEII